MVGGRGGGGGEDTLTCILWFHGIKYLGWDPHSHYAIVLSYNWILTFRRNTITPSSRSKIKMEVEYSSETLASIYQTSWRQNAEHHSRKWVAISFWKSGLCPQIWCYFVYVFLCVTPCTAVVQEPTTSIIRVLMLETHSSTTVVPIETNTNCCAYHTTWHLSPLRPGTHYPHVTRTYVMLRVRLWCVRRFNIEFYGADSHFCHSTYATWDHVT
jgi:hypothetical protein